MTAMGGAGVSFVSSSACMTSSRAWQTPAAKRLLVCVDVLAALTTLLATAVSFARLHVPLADYAALQQLRPGQTVFTSYTAHAAAASAALLMLVVPVWRAGLYAKYRTQLCVLNRLTRLFISSGLASVPKARGPVAFGVGAHVFELSLTRPAKALGVTVLRPLAFFMSQAVFLLPIKVFVLFQLAQTVATLQWSAALPCYLQQAAAAAGSSTRVPVFAAAEAVCVRMHELAAFLQLTAALPEVMLGTASAPCSGAAAVRVLHSFATICGLFVLPVAGVAGLEWRLAASSSSSGHEVSTTTAHTGSGTSSRADSQRLGTSRSTSSVASAAAGSSSSSSSHASSSRGIPGTPPRSNGMHRAVMVPPPLWLVGLLVPVVLALVWSVSEVLAGVAGARVDCTAELHAGGVLFVDRR